jgi:predicted glycoside hydrolase/deacetylase ChbG (UPF0249 family)
MLIINADDLGRDREASTTGLAGFAEGSITSASVMVFMSDSEGAARSAQEAGLETGLHLNLTQPYDGPGVADSLRRSQRSVVRYLRLGKWAQVVYNPLLNRDLSVSVQAQLDEYRRLFQREPAHFNGHNHMHLCMNMLVKPLIPAGSAVRRSFTFRRGEKGIWNRLYRRGVDARLEGRYRTTEAFFSLDPTSDLARLGRIVDLARTMSVELMVHAWRPDQFKLLKSDEFRKLIRTSDCGAFSLLGPRRGGC